MACSDALDAARPDALGLRWAKGRRDGWTFLVCLDADGRATFELKTSPRGHPATQRLTEEPHGVEWQPLAPVIREAA